MRDLGAELKQLRLHGMASTWADLIEQDQAGLDSARWLIEHLLQAETTDRAVRSVSHQMHAAKFPVHRDWPASTSQSPRWTRNWYCSWPRSTSPTRRTTWCWSAVPSTRHDAHLATLLKLNVNLILIRC